MQSNILIVEDEEDILHLIKYNLNKTGFNAIGVESGESALKIIYKQNIDLILLDIMLPGMDGIEFCKAIRHESKFIDLPVIMLTAKGEESDIISGLENGADDYIVKPFSPKVLIARINAVLRRKNARECRENDVVKIHELEIDPGRYKVLLEGQNIELTKTEYMILNFLARRPGWVFTRYQIVDKVKGEDYCVTDRAIDVTIVSLRKKLGKKFNYIETVRGIGYRFKDFS